MLWILGLIFVVLKLEVVGVVASWSWWLVLSPWIVASVIILLMTIYCVKY